VRAATEICRLCPSPFVVIVLPQVANLLCQGQRKHTMCALQSESEISLEVSSEHFENAKSLQTLGDCSGGRPDLLATGVCSERSASAVRGDSGSESNDCP